MKKAVFILLQIIIISSCNSTPKEVQEVLDSAGDNRPELEKVIMHYSQNHADRLKLKAAYFLIENSDKHGSYYYIGNNEFDQVFEKIGEINPPEGEQRRAAWDSVAPIFENIDQNRIKFYMDNQIITSDFLIENIESAFNSWDTYPWCKNISFEDFKQFILPYRMSNEPVEKCRDKFQKIFSWVLDSIKDKASMEEAFKLVYNDFYSNYGTTGATKYPIPMTYSQVLLARSALCEDVSNTLGMVLRSMGIKCAFDYSVQWGNQKNAIHSWISFVKNDSLTYYIDKDKIFRIPEYVHSGKYPVDEPGSKYLVDSIKPQLYKKGTKIRRSIFGKNSQSIYLKARNKEEIPEKMNDYTSTDVTNHYIKTSDLHIKIKDDLHKYQFLFLTVFGTENESIVDWTEIKGKDATFKNLGINVVYFPSVFKNGLLKHVCTPVLLKMNDQIRLFLPDTLKKQTIKIRRKYPVLAPTLNNANYLYQGKFQGSNHADFSDAVDLFKIDNTYLFPTEIEIKEDTKFRFFRFQASPSSDGSIAEVGFYTTESGIDKKLQGKIIGNQRGLFGRTPEKAFDEDFASFYMGKALGSWIGLDLGERNEKKINKIRFSPRSDTNFIIPGNEYELFYWDKDWVSLGKKSATDYQLIFTYAPSGALFWLHCLSGGLEERPFSYENEKQIWW
jgi:hypothetical protein